MAFNSQKLSDVSGFDIKQVIPDSAFIDILNPTDTEVYTWAGTINRNDRQGMFLFYSEITPFNYEHAWILAGDSSNYFIARVKDKSSSSITVEDPDGTSAFFGKFQKVNDQVRFTDSNGNMIFFNVIEGDFEITSSARGVVYKSPNLDRFRIRMENNGIPIIENL